MTRVGTRRNLLAPCLLACLVACGNSGEPASDASSTTNDDTTTAVTTDLPTTTDATTTTTTTTTDTTTGSVELIVTTEVLRYEAQPMVVDVILTTSAPATSVVLSHTSDPGVVITSFAVDGLATTYRVRGLAPATDHELAYDVDGTQSAVQFTTHAPLPGFLPSFPSTGGPVDPAVPYRMFDLIAVPAFDIASVFMVDADGTTRWQFSSPSTGVAGPEGVYSAVRLRADGSLMYLHNHTMWIRDELGETVLELHDEAVGVLGLHHEVIELPSGNFVALSFAFQEVDYGKNGVRLTAGDRIVEFTPAGELVWSWNSFDHLDPQRVLAPFDAAVIHPETLANTYDWTHGNAIVHDPKTDTFLLSLRHQDWILLIDHKTGELLWKLGNDGDFTLTGAPSFFHHQHAPEWQSDGSLLLYDNGIGDPDIPPGTDHARARRYALDQGKLAAKLVWTDDGEPIQVPIAGNADTLPSGRILVTDSSIFTVTNVMAQLRELDPLASPMLQWSLQTPDGTFAYRGSAHDRLIGQTAP
ncbi:aryl-sulfate sulfotransferase [Nannocystis sp.]|uniref:aryl-sulfate sulfotransferase n=1 Tax=Nannocystis sp. TaxID=1962667 RepID=UPI0025FFFEA9|nr:aryl-sulfate sulfotransferase [Nannocystis sp.]MBK7825793.1 aryl-sulfate sulfotransferase [Nannocystis sp.]